MVVWWPSAAVLQEEAVNHPELLRSRAVVVSVVGKGVLRARAVAVHTDRSWVLLYVERWLKAPLQREDGSVVERDRGTPQGSAISPLLANMFMHYAFDAWMVRECPAIRFERYCDDVIVHATSESQARKLRDEIAGRLAECGLQLNESKTQIVYCKDVHRGLSYYELVRFDFLGYTFRPRLSRSKRGSFVSFSPAVSGEAAKRMRRECAVGTCTDARTRPSRTWHGCLIPCSGVGSTTTDTSTSPCCLRPSAISTRFS